MFWLKRLDAVEKMATEAIKNSERALLQIEEYIRCFREKDNHAAEWRKDTADRIKAIDRRIESFAKTMTFGVLIPVLLTIAGSLIVAVAWLVVRYGLK